MHWIQSVIWWFAGGLETPYHSLSHCMHQDWFWITVTVTLDLLVAIGYIQIAYHWSVNEKALPPSPARSALHTMRNIFAFCGMCGYLFIPIKMFWPAWRLYDMFMVGLVFYTWRYALNARNLKVIYTAIGASGQLADDLAKSRDESKRKSFFLNAISHDLRTPLNGMMLHANLAELHLSGTDGPAAQQSINEIKVSIRTTVEMLEGLLEYARLESPDETVTKSKVEIGELIGDIYKNHQPMAARKSLELLCTPCNGLTLSTDRLRLERILNNLVSNAVKFTAAGWVKIEVEPLPGKMQISVIDTGIGIAPEHQSRLFEEFFQVQNYERDRHKGFGLGLAICNRLVRQLDGEITCQSQPGKGSRFTVVLPDEPTPLKAEKMQKIAKRLVLICSIATLTAGAVTGPLGCASAYYAAWSKLGYEKRDILVSRVEGARDDQDKAKTQFKSTLDQFKELTGFNGGDLDTEYHKLKSSYEKCQDRAAAVSKQIASVDKVANAMFDEWNTELADYHDESLRASSEQKLNDSKAKYAQLLAAMKNSEAKMQPVLDAFGDRVHYLRDNLNAAAISSLQGTSGQIDTNVQDLIKDMDTSINEANAFIDNMKKA